MMLGLALPGLASGGSVYCGCLGYGYTTTGSGSIGNRSHYMAGNFGGTTVGTNQTIYHGAHSGSPSWGITGVGQGSAICPQ